MCRTITNGQRLSGEKLGHILVRKLQSLDFNLAKIIFVFEMVLGINDEMIRSFCCLQSLIYFYICNILAKTINRNYVRCVLKRLGELICFSFSWDGGFLFFFLWSRGSPCSHLVLTITYMVLVCVLFFCELLSTRNQCRINGKQGSNLAHHFLQI